MFAVKLLADLHANTQRTNKQKSQHDNFLLSEFRFVLIDENTPTTTIPLFKDARKDTIDERSFVLSFNIVDNDSNTLGYITPHDLEARKYICQSSCISKGQFVIKVDNDKYMGLTDEGVVTKSLREYAVALRTGIGNWQQKYNGEGVIGIIPSIANTLGCLISCLFVMRRFDTWSYFDGGGTNKIIDAW